MLVKPNMSSILSYKARKFSAESVIVVVSLLVFREKKSELIVCGFELRHESSSCFCCTAILYFCSLKTILYHLFVFISFSPGQ